MTQATSAVPHVRQGQPREAGRGKARLTAVRGKLNKPPGSPWRPASHFVLDGDRCWAALCLPAPL